MISVRNFMGHKISPISLRIGINKTWQSKWFLAGKKEYRTSLLADIKIRKFLQEKLKKAGLALCEIERQADKIKIILHSSRPGVIIGRSGVGIEGLKKEVQKIVPNNKMEISIVELKNPESNAVIIAQSMVEQIEKRIGYRRIAKKTIERVKEAIGVEGVKVMIGGRLDGNEIARTEWFAKGKLPLHTLRADIDFAKAEAHTTYGAIGVKVWVYKGEVFK